MRVLVGVPTYPRRPFVRPLTQQTVEAMVQQSSHDVTLVYLESSGMHGGHYPDLLAKHQAVRRQALDEGFDALMLVEADMVVRLDCLDQLAAVEGDIAYSLYCSRTRQMWLLFREMTPTQGKSIVHWPEQARAAWGNVVESEGAGLGATLIHRNVLERIDFRLDEQSPFADDWHFALDAKRLDFRQVHHCGCPSGHILRQTNLQTVVAWPAVDGEKFARIEIIRAYGERERMKYRVLKPLTGPKGRRMPGDVAEFSGEEAAVLERRGCIEPVRERKPKAASASDDEQVSEDK